MTEYNIGVWGQGIKSPDSDSLMQRKSNEARGWELDPSDITICTLPDGSDWLLGKGGGGAVFRGLRCGVQDVAVKIMYQVSAADLKQFNKVRPSSFLRGLGNLMRSCACENNEAPNTPAHNCLK